MEKKLLFTVDYGTVILTTSLSFQSIVCTLLNHISCTHHWRSWQTRRWKQSRRPDCWSLQTPPSGPGGRCQSFWWCHRWIPPPRRRPRPQPIPSLHQGLLGTRWAPRNVKLHTVPCPVKTNDSINDQRSGQQFKKTKLSRRKSLFSKEGNTNCLPFWRLYFTFSAQLMFT